MVTKEPSEYYKLKGKYRFGNLIKPKEAFVGGRSNPTTPELRWEMLPIMREQAIDRALNMLAVYLRPNNREEFKLQWFLVEILNEEWTKW